MNALAASVERLRAAGFEDPRWTVSRPQDWPTTEYQFRGCIGEMVHGYVFLLDDRLTDSARFDIEAAELQKAEQRLIRKTRPPNE